jgi:transcriptional regulator with XRE-family HTH domain
MEENSERGARLKDALGDRSNAWLAKQIGVVASTVHGYVHGKVPPADVALRICDVLGIDIRWYIDGQRAAVAKGDRLIEVPLVGYSGAAPAGIAYAESFLKHLAQDPMSVRCMISSGVAMAPTVPEHAEVLYLPGQEVVDGAAHVVGIRSRLLVRRIRLTASGEMEAVCDNPAFVREGADLIEPDQVVGRVLWVAHAP